MLFTKKLAALLLAITLSWTGQAKNFGWNQEEVMYICEVNGFTLTWETTTSVGVLNICETRPWSFCWPTPCKMIRNDLY